MKYIIFITIAIGCTSFASKAQDTLSCDCLEQYNESINASQAFIEMKSTFNNGKSEFKDIASALTSISELGINNTYKEGQALNTLQNEAVQLCTKIYTKLDTSNNSEIRKKIKSGIELNNDNFERCKSILACYALKKFVKEYNEIAIKNFKIEQKSEEKNKNGFNWWLVAFFIVLSVAISLSIYFIRELKDKKRYLTAYVQNFELQTKDQLKAIEDLNSQLAAINNEIHQRNRFEKRPEIIQSTNHIPTQPTSVPSTTPLKRIYMRPPNGNLFSRESDSMRVYETYYMIDVNPDGKTGVLRLVDDVATMEHAFSMIDVLRNACDLNGNNQPSSASQARQSPGEVEMTSDGYWKIREKISLSW